MNHKYFPDIFKKENGEILFPTVFAKSLYLKDNQTAKIEKAPPIYFNDQKICFAVENYINELEELIEEIYQTTLIEKNKKYLDMAIQKIELLYR